MDQRLKIKKNTSAVNNIFWSKQTLIFHGKLFDSGVSFMFFFWFSADYFQNQLFRKIHSGKPSECQTVWIQI